MDLLLLAGMIAAALGCGSALGDELETTAGRLQAGTGLNAEYYDTENFRTLKLKRVDPTVDFMWGNGSPATSIAPDTFSVRWTGYVVARYSGLYKLSLISDDGSRLWVNNQLLVDRFTYHAAVEYSGTIQLTAGEAYPIRVDYFEGNGGAQIQLLWSSPQQSREVIPATLLYPSNPLLVDGGTSPVNDGGTSTPDAGNPGTPDSGTPGAPVINSFTASPAAINPGGSSTLAWNVSGATSLSLDPSIGNVTGTSRSVSPPSTTTYTLSARNSAGVTRATVSVTVAPPPGTGSTLSGTLTTRTLTAAGSPYTITGNLAVPAGNRLTIEPGVKLIFNGRYKLAIRGRLTAQGTAANPITFTAANTSTGWLGLRLTGNDAGADFIEYCIFEFANKAGGQDGAGPDGPYSEVSGGALYFNARSNINFNHNTVRFNKAPGFGGGLMLISLSGPSTAVGNSFLNNQVTGPLTQFQGTGGGMYADHLPASARWTFRGGEFRNNSAPQGGGMFVGESFITLDSIGMSGNTPQNWVTDDPRQLTILNTPLP